MKPLVAFGSRKNLDPATIILLKAETNYTYLYFNDGSRILSSTTLGILETRLKDFPFIRPNRSVLINMDYILESDLLQLKMTNNEIVKISRRRINVLHNLETNYRKAV